MADWNGTSYTDYIYANGQKIAKASFTGATSYFLADHLGTTQMELDPNGSLLWQGWFTPFGKEVGTGYAIGPQQPDGTSMRYKFTGKEQDAESGLDQFPFRNYAPTMGRWIRPDPGWAQAMDLANPQSLNQYAYVFNNPLSFVDPLGLDGAKPAGVCSAGILCRLGAALGAFFAFSLDGISSGGGDPDPDPGFSFRNGLLQSQAQQQNGTTAKARGNKVTYTYPDGSKVVLKGDHPFRDNNPGDLRSGHGAIGRDHGFCDLRFFCGWIRCTGPNINW